jgi:hypothetical protein
MQYITIQLQITSLDHLQTDNLICQLVLFEVAEVVLVGHHVRDVLLLALLEQRGGERGQQPVVQRVALQHVQVGDETGGIYVRHWRIYIER